MAVKLYWRSLSNGRKSAYIVVHINGERYKKSLNIVIEKGDFVREKKSLAEKARAMYQLKIESEEYDHIPSFYKNVDFIAYFQKFLDNYKKKNSRRVRYSLEKFKLFIGKDKIPFSAINNKVCEDFAYFLKNNAGLSGGTPYDYWKQFKKVLRQAEQEKIIKSNPANDIVFTRAEQKDSQLTKSILTADELKLMLNTECGNETLKRAFLFSCYTGLGVAEIRKLTWKKITNGRLIVNREKTDSQLVNDLHPFALKMAGEKGTGIVFADLPSDKAISKCLKNWVKRAGIDKNISYYCARHTFAVLLLKAGVNLKTVADCLGHSSTRHTLKYLNHVDELKEKAINSLPNI